MKNVCPLSIVVGDIERFLHFYRNLLGLEIQEDTMEEGRFIGTIIRAQKSKSGNSEDDFREW